MQHHRLKQRGVTLTGLIFWCVLLGALALLVMRLFPLYNEKMKVDQAMDRVANDASVSNQDKLQLVDAIMKQFEISDVDRWSTVEFSRLLKLEKKANSENRVMSLEYEIRNTLCCDLDIVLKYHNTHTIPYGKLPD